MSRYQHFSCIPPASRPLPHGAEQSGPSAASHVDSTTGRWGAGGGVFPVSGAMWVPNIKGDREFAVPIRASRSKPGARRIKARSHLPANPRQECFLPSIVFFFLPTGKTYSSHSRHCAQGPTPRRWQVWTPHLPPDCPSTLLQRGCPGFPPILQRCRCSGRRKEPGFRSGGLGLSPTPALTF